jgi:hypothetical protein
VPSQGQPYSLIGSNGALLVMMTTTRGIPDETPPSSYLVTLPVGTLSAHSTPLTSIDYAYAAAGMVDTTPGAASTGLVIINTESANARPGPPPPTHATEVLTPNGTVKAAIRGYDTYFAGGTSALSGYLFQVGNHSWPAGLGPWTVSALNLETLTSTGLQTPGGAFTVPNGEYPQFTGLSNFIGAGAYAGQGLAYDLSQNLLVPIIIPDTNVAPL